MKVERRCEVYSYLRNGYGVYMPIWLEEFVTCQMNSQLFVRTYQLYLPEREDLRRELENTLKEAQS